MSEREQPRKSSKKKARRSFNKASPSAKVRRNSKTSKERRSSTTRRRGSNNGSSSSKARRSSSTKGSKKKSKDRNSPSLSPSSKKKSKDNNSPSLSPSSKGRKSSPRTIQKVHNDLNKSENKSSDKSERSQKNVTEKASVLISKDIVAVTDIKAKIIPVMTATTASTSVPILRTPRPDSTRGRKDRMALIRMNMKKTNLAIAEKRKTKFQSGIGRKIDPYNTSNLRISVIQGRNNRLDQRNKYARYSEAKPDTKSLPSLRNASLALAEGRRTQMNRSNGLSAINSIPQSNNNFGQSPVGNNPSNSNTLTSNETEETIDKRLLESEQPATTLQRPDDGTGIRRASIAVVSDRRRANQEALDVNKKLDEHRQRQSRTHNLIKKNLQTL